MGTNYYATYKATEELKQLIIEKIKEGDFRSARILMPEKIHIGKSSAGWQFLFNHNNWQYFKKDLLDLELFLKICNISDEYGREISYEDFWELVNAKKNEKNKSGLELFGLRFSEYTDFS